MGWAGPALVPGLPHVPDDPDDYLVPPPRVTAVGFHAHLSPEDRAAYEAIRSPQSVYCFSEKARLTGARERIPLKTSVLATGYQNTTFTKFAERLRKRPDQTGAPAARISRIRARYGLTPSQYVSDAAGNSTAADAAIV